jgi:hypothetical protein
MPPVFRQPPIRQAALGVLCALALWGCSARSQIDALEADLRGKEQAQEELQSQLARSEEDLKVARSDNTALRQQLNKNHQVSLSEEQADVLYRAESIKFNSLLTSGQNRDGQPGDDGLSVMIIPVDEHGDLVKLAGEVELELFDMSLSADRQRLGHWKFSTEVVRQHWHRGFVGTGYLFQVDWQGIPVASELTLHARLGINDGRKFDATTQVKVVPPAPQVPPVADVGAADRQGAARRKRPAGSRSVVPAAGSVITRRPVRPDDDAPGGEMPPLKKSRARTPLRGEQGESDSSPTTTSDRWTDETIPTLR